MRLIRARPRLLISAAVGLVGMAVLPSEWRLAGRLLIAWDVAVTLYLVLLVALAAGSPVARIRRRAADDDAGRIGILVLTVVAALASLGAIVAELSTSLAVGGERRGDQLILVALTILLS